MSMGITVSYHINNIECTPLHIFPNPQATSDNMRVCTAFCWKSLLPLETCDWVNLYCQNSSHHKQQKHQPRMKVYTQFWLCAPHFWHPLLNKNLDISVWVKPKTQRILLGFLANHWHLVQFRPNAKEKLNPVLKKQNSMK